MSENCELLISVESDEDECESFFLQPASSPYNLAEKVKEANNKLEDQSPQNPQRPIRIQFKENLVDYEPQWTSDDASSIHSEDVFGEPDYHLVEDYELEEQFKASLNFHAPIIENGPNRGESEQDEINEDLDLEEVSEVGEELTAVQCLDLGVNFTNHNDTNMQSVESFKIDAEHQGQTLKVRKKHKKPPINREQIANDITCDKHCIERLNRSRCEENSSKYKCPILKLRERKCCVENQMKHEQKLPNYTGLRSEYGLSRLQLEHKRTSIRIRHNFYEERQKLRRLDTERKIEQNEQIFCDWLMAINNRSKTTRTNNAREKIERPQTALAAFCKKKKCHQKTLIKKIRPHSSSARIFIEVPQKVLEGGFTVGDLFVKKNSVGNEGLNIVAFKD